MKRNGAKFLSRVGNLRMERRRLRRSLKLKGLNSLNRARMKKKSSTEKRGRFGQKLVKLFISH